MLKKILLGVFCFIFYLSCTEPVEPEFELKEGVITVDAIVATAEGGSFVTIKESVIELGRDQYINIFMRGAEVSFINTNTGELVNLIEYENIYIPPFDFVASVNDTWELDIKLQDGRHYKSLAETILEPVEISYLEANYAPKYAYNAALNDYVPGHSISVSFNDPAEKNNYYYWNFRSFEKRDFCKLCYGFYRNGICEPFDLEPEITPNPEYYTYDCESDCWGIRYNENIKIFEDEFTNGSSINSLPIADVLLYTKADILVEVQQFSLSKAAYSYYKVLKDLVDNNSGFNAPPPAALIGNMFNPDNSEEYVLGRFTAAATSIQTIFIERSGIAEPAISSIEIIPEGSVVYPRPSLPPGGPVLYAPCEEGRYVTSNRPENWPIN